MSRRARWLAAAIAAAVAAGAGAQIPPCTLPANAGALLADGPVRLAWQALPAPIAVSRSFELRVALCPAAARLARVDATMPEHRHGMNYRPSLRAVDAGRWQVQGLLWHMSGRWELQFDVELDGAMHTLRQSVELR